jgi:hypothetical protein
LGILEKSAVTMMIPSNNYTEIITSSVGLEQTDKRVQTSY